MSMALTSRLSLITPRISSGISGDGEQVNGADGDDNHGDGVDDGSDQVKSKSSTAARWLGYCYSVTM